MSKSSSSSSSSSSSALGLCGYTRVRVRAWVAISWIRVGYGHSSMGTGKCGYTRRFIIGLYNDKPNLESGMDILDTADWWWNNYQLETDVAECIGAWTSWRVVVTDHSCLCIMTMMMRFYWDTVYMYATSYKSITVTLVLACTVSEILQVFCAPEWPQPVLFNFGGVPVASDRPCWGHPQQKP